VRRAGPAAVEGSECEAGSCAGPCLGTSSWALLDIALMAVEALTDFEFGNDPTGAMFDRAWTQDEGADCVGRSVHRVQLVRESAYEVSGEALLKLDAVVAGPEDGGQYDLLPGW
jgi:hypothetical protein